ncbi:hypothetical protein ACLIIZ_14750 [Azonexus caeni]|jgi:hypothetical protein|uniref:hypothetical protein n=1 Tax=Azonexus caeni TaxID=266126 RepID=UPI003A89CD87
MPSPILARADALMHRRHSSGENEEVPLLTDAIDVENDIPVLVDVAPTVAAPPPPAPRPTPPKAPATGNPATTPVPPLDTDWGAALAEELGRRIEARLLAEIPKIVATTVAELLGDPETLKRHRRR